MEEETVLYIHSYCRIDNVKVQSGSLFLEQSDGSDFLQQLYYGLNVQYTKFFKMDSLCKAGFLAAEILMQRAHIPFDEPKRNWAIVCFNATSSLDTDIRYQATIQDPNNYFPSPSAFVYTLANIVTGEIAIRHKIMGDTLSFILPQFSARRIVEMAENILVVDGDIDNMICGWVDYLQGQCDVLLFVISKDKQADNKNLTVENIETIRNLTK